MSRRLGLALVLLLLAGCATSKGGASGGAGSASGGKTACAAPGTPIPEAGLTASETRELVEKLAASVLRGPWLKTLTAEKGRKPVLRFYPLRNRTPQPINTLAMAKQLQELLHRSQQVTLVAEPDEAVDLREARAKAGGAQGEELGADAIGSGMILVQEEAPNATQTFYLYQVNLQLVDVTAGRKLWVDTLTIKKMVEQLPPCPPKR